MEGRAISPKLKVQLRVCNVIRQKDRQKNRLEIMRYLASLAVRLRRRTVDPNVRASMSSVAVAYTLPDLVRAAH